MTARGAQSLFPRLEECRLPAPARPERFAGGVRGCFHSAGLHLQHGELPRDGPQALRDAPGPHSCGPGKLVLLALASSCCACQPHQNARVNLIKMRVSTSSSSACQPLQVARLNLCKMRVLTTRKPRVVTCPGRACPRRPLALLANSRNPAVPQGLSIWPLGALPYVAKPLAYAFLTTGGRAGHDFFMPRAPRVLFIALG